MPELRWTLLIIGVLFVAILAWWERRRPHQASRQAPHISGEPRPVMNNDPSWGPEVDSGNSRVMREPTLTLPEIRTESRTREPLVSRELPVVEISDDVADQVEQAMAAGAPVVARTPGVPSMPVSTGKPVAPPKAPPPSAPPPIVARPAVAKPEPEFDPDPDADAEGEGEGESEEAVEFAEPAAASEPAAQSPTPAVNTVRPIVDWPPEDQRKLVSLRLVARPPDRFRGNLVRQALSAEGFVLGDLDIFHKPDAQNRSVLSVASVTKPGAFDMETMDTQRFVGLNLFAVLPGPRAPLKAFEDLLLTARMLNERLEGALQDERGGPLTPTRIQAIRDALGAEAKS